MKWNEFPLVVPVTDKIVFVLFISQCQLSKPLYDVSYGYWSIGTGWMISNTGDNFKPIGDDYEILFWFNNVNIEGDLAYRDESESEENFLLNVKEVIENFYTDLNGTLAHLLVKYIEEHREKIIAYGSDVYKKKGEKND